MPFAHLFIPQTRWGPRGIWELWPWPLEESKEQKISNDDESQEIECSKCSSYFLLLSYTYIEEITFNFAGQVPSTSQLFSTIEKFENWSGMYYFIIT